MEAIFSGEVVFRATDASKNICTPLKSSYFSSILKDVQKKRMTSKDSNVAWSEEAQGVLRLYVGLVQIYTDKTATELMSKKLVA